MPKREGEVTVVSVRGSLVDEHRIMHARQAASSVAVYKTRRRGAEGGIRQYKNVDDILAAVRVVQANGVVLHRFHHFTRDKRWEI